MTHPEPAPVGGRQHVHLFDGTRCTHCNANDMDVDLYAEDEYTCPPRWLTREELTARDAAHTADEQQQNRACTACHSIRHTTADCIA